ncbi:MAG: tannase/feruloyl esterase family alpha/beta hydrolase [Steroidobacteraceae bacterium]
MAAIHLVLIPGVCGLLLVAGTSSAAQSPDVAQRCANITQAMQGQWPDPSTRIVSANFRPDGALTAPTATPGPPAAAVPLPGHCEIMGVLQERMGMDGRAYAIRFHVRLPEAWNERLLFQGGGGSDGVIGDALGPTRSPALGGPVAAARGFAVVSEDSGHDNATDSDPRFAGPAAFGFDAEARENFGHAALKSVTDAAKALLGVYYGKRPHWSYFEGCSKGGQEALAVAERYPADFDGIVAGAPGLSLPRAAIAEAWDTQTYGAENKVPGASLNVNQLATSFSDADLKLVAAAVLSACDADDGVIDGMVGDFEKCTAARVHPQLQQRTCEGGKQDSCLTPMQVAALLRAFGGPRDSRGASLYSEWPWDPGITAPGWRMWKLGTAGGLPSINVVLGAGALASIFTTPPTAVSSAPQALLDFLMAFDFDRDAPKIYATHAQFPRSAWSDISMRSTDFRAFYAHGGKLLIYQGAADPVFSLNDTVSWFQDVQRRSGTSARAFTRLFAVPGMSHCNGGPATDQFDALGALTQWVEQGQAPERIAASAGKSSPWPGRTRPLCPYPKIARYTGKGDIERAENFQCR